jgi:hypothetical protein
MPKGKVWDYAKKGRRKKRETYEALTIKKWDT